MQLTHTIWISNVAKCLFSLFGGECLATVAEREVNFEKIFFFKVWHASKCIRKCPLVVIQRENVAGRNQSRIENE